MKTSISFLYESKTGNIKYLDKNKFVKEIIYVIARQKNTVFDHNEINKANILSYKEIINKFNKNFKKLTTGIYVLKVDNGIGIICLIDKQTIDFEKFCKKNNWKWGKEVENIEKNDNNSKKLLAKSKNLGIIYNKDLIRNYKPKESKEELKSMNRKMIKRFAVASLAALMTIPNLMACEKQEVKKEPIKLDILDRIDKEVSEEIDKISNYNIKEVVEYVGAKQVKIEDPDQKAAAKFELILQNLGYDKIKNGLYKMYTDGNVDEDKYNVLIEKLENNKDNPEIIIKSIIDEDDNKLFNAVLTEELSDDEIKQFKIYLDKTTAGSNTNTGNLTERGQRLLKFKDYSKDVKEIIVKYEGKDTNDMLNNFWISEDERKALKNEGLYLVGFAGNRSDIDHNLKIMTEDEYFDYVDKFREEHKNELDETGQIKNGDWAGIPSVYEVHNDSETTMVEKAIDRYLINSYREEEENHIKLVETYIQLNPDSSSPAKYINMLGGGQYFRDSVSGNVFTKDGSIYTNSFGVNEYDLYPATRYADDKKARGLYQAVEIEVFKRNNPDCRLVNETAARYSNTKYKVYLLPLGRPGWVDRDWKNSSAYGVFGNVVYPYVQKSFPEFKEYCQGTDVAFYEWRDKKCTEEAAEGKGGYYYDGWALRTPEYRLKYLRSELADNVIENHNFMQSVPLYD